MHGGERPVGCCDVAVAADAAGSRSRRRWRAPAALMSSSPIGVGELDSVRPFVLEGGLPLGIRVGFGRFFEPSPDQGCLPARNGHNGHLTASQSRTSLTW